MVRLQVFVFAPPLEQLPDHTASRPLLTLRVTSVPVAKLAVPLVPTATRSPAGLDETDSPERPVAVSVSDTVDEMPPPQTLATPPPPHVWGLVQLPQTREPPQPSEIVPQFLPCAAHVVRVHVLPAVIVSGAVTVPASCAVIVAVVVVCTEDVPTGKVPVV
jgi:hypothetical protein